MLDAVLDVDLHLRDAHDFQNELMVGVLSDMEEATHPLLHLQITKLNYISLLTQ